MDKSTTVLNTVVVSGFHGGGDILRAAPGRIDLTTRRIRLLEGFYRDVKQIAGTYVSLLEAAVRIYDDNYKEPRNKSKLRERVALQEVRRSIGYSSKFTTYFDQDNLLEVLLLNNDVRYRLLQPRKSFSNLRRDADSWYNGREILLCPTPGILPESFYWQEHVWNCSRWVWKQFSEDLVGCGDSPINLKAWSVW